MNRQLSSLTSCSGATSTNTGVSFMETKSFLAMGSTTVNTTIGKPIWKLWIGGDKAIQACP